MIDIIKNRESIPEIGKIGRSFVEQYHNHIDIAKQYIEIFENS